MTTENATEAGREFLVQQLRKLFQSHSCCDPWCGHAANLIETLQNEVSELRAALHDEKEGITATLRQQELDAKDATIAGLTAQRNDAMDQASAHMLQLARQLEQINELTARAELAEGKVGELIALLTEAAPIVHACAESQHMLDGFGPRKERCWDGLNRRIKEALATPTPSGGETP